MMNAYAPFGRLIDRPSGAIWLLDGADAVMREIVSRSKTLASVDEVVDEVVVKSFHSRQKQRIDPLSKIDF
jgi:hypothetical protein